MQASGLNNMKARKEFWEHLTCEQSADDLARALAAIPPTSAQVLTWHYQEGKTFKQIKELLNRSISTVRNHHSRGMFELQRYFNCIPDFNNIRNCKV
jgi:RNA polymerase sigma factor (sigma-70 family)